MSNVITPKLIKIDTAAEGILLWRVFIQSITWIGSGAPADEAIVTDQNGNRIARFIAGDSNDTESKYAIGWVNGLSVPTLESGELEIILA